MCEMEWDQTVGLVGWGLVWIVVRRVEWLGMVYAKAYTLLGK